jgi:hypothetical protein
VADDINLPSLSGYLEYVRHPANGYVSVAFYVENGMEKVAGRLMDHPVKKMRYDCENQKFVFHYCSL